MKLRHLSLLLIICTISFNVVFASNESNYFKFGRNNKLVYPQANITYNQYKEFLRQDFGIHSRLHSIARIIDEKNDVDLTWADKNFRGFGNELSKKIDELQALNGIGGFFKSAADKEREGTELLNSIINNIKQFERRHPDVMNKLATDEPWLGKNRLQMVDNTNKYLPEFCKNYPSLGIESYKDYMGQENAETLKGTQAENVFTCTQSDGGLFSVSVENLVNQYAKIENYTFKDRIDSFKQKMMNESLLQVTQSRHKLQGLFDGLNTHQTEGQLNQCIQNQATQKRNPELAHKFEQQEKDLQGQLNQMAPNDKANRKTAYMRHLMLDALKAEVIKTDINEANRHYRAIEAAEYEKIDPRTLAMAGGMANLEYTKPIRDAKKVRDEKLREAQSKLASMYQEHPSLFAIENNWTLFDWNNNELNTSPLQKNIVANSKDAKEAQEIVQGLRAARERGGQDGGEAAQNAFLEQNQEKITQFFDRKINDSTFQSHVRASIENEINELNKSALHLCEKDGENLHHFPQLANNVFMKVANLAANSEDAKTEVMKHQSAYCHLMRQNPPKDNNFGIYDAIGIGAVAIGMFIPGPGWAIAGAGAALLAAQSLNRFNEARLTEKNSGALLRGNWESIDSYLKNRDALGDATADLALESLIIFDGLAVVSAIKRGTTGARAISTSRNITVKRSNQVARFIDALPPQTMSKLEDATKLMPRNSEQLMGDFLTALSESDGPLVKNFLSKVERGDWSPRELHKIMDDAVKNFRQACL